MNRFCATIILCLLSGAARAMGDGLEIDSGGTGLAKDAVHADHWRFPVKVNGTATVKPGAFVSNATAFFDRELISAPVTVTFPPLPPGAATATGILTLAPKVYISRHAVYAPINLTIDAGPLADKFAGPLKTAVNSVTTQWETLLNRVEILGVVIIGAVVAGWIIHVAVKNQKLSRQ